MVVREGEIVRSIDGRTLTVEPSGGEDLPEDLAEIFSRCYTVNMGNYMVEDEYLHRPEVVQCG
jgi:formylmethanofuran dehydrogenase subunit A